MKNIPTSVRLLQLASVVLIFHVGNSLLQEQVFHLPGFNHALLLSFLQTICVATFALVDYIRKTGFERKTPIQYYLVISLLAVVASFATNEASLRLNYPTQVIFKSSKLLAVMFVRSIMMKQHKLTSMDLASALTVIAGLAAFTYGTHQSKQMMKLNKIIGSTTPAPIDDGGDHHLVATTSAAAALLQQSSSFMIGVIAVLIAVGADALLYIVEEKYCFHTFGSSNGEIIVFLNGFAALHAGAALTVSGKLGESLSYLSATETLLPLVIAFSLCNFIGTTAILSVVSEFGSPSAIIVTNTRKVCTILGSYLVYPKPFTFLHAVGLVLVTGGVYAHETARKKKGGSNSKDGFDGEEKKNDHHEQQQSNSTSINMIQESSPLIIPPTTPA